MQVDLSNVALRRKRGGFSLEIEELTLQSGEIVLLSGPSGCGKTTLLRLIGGIETPNKGMVSLGENAISALSDRERRRIRSRQIGIVFQQPTLIPYLTAFQNVLLVERFSKLCRVTSSSMERARGLLADVGLENRLHHYPTQLSGGEQQRVAACRALLTRPPLLLLDEPTSNLDSSSASLVWNLIKSAHDLYGPTIVIAAHDDEIPMPQSRRVALCGGRLIQ